MVSIVYNIDWRLAPLPLRFDLAVVDGPYGIGESGKNHKSRGKIVKKTGKRIRRAPSNNYERKNWDNAPISDSDIIRITNISDNWIFWGANYFQYFGTPFKAPRREEFDQFIKDHPTGWIIWDKCNGKNDFSDCELAFTSFDRPTVIFKFMWAGMRQGKSITEGHIMQGNKSKDEKRCHPTQKPIIIYDWTYLQYLPNGGTVLDPYLGSGSSRISADKRGNIHFYGCETEIEYFELHQSRWENHKSQLNLFSHAH